MTPHLYKKVISFINSCVKSSQNKLNILSNSVFGGEMDMYHRIQEIEEPQDFVKNNSIVLVIYNYQKIKVKR